MDDYTIKSAEKQAILKALRKTRGNRRDAAGLLGCGKTTLYRKIEIYKLAPDDWECIPISDLPAPKEESEVESTPEKDCSDDPTLECGPEPSMVDLEMGMNPTSDEFPINDVG